MNTEAGLAAERATLTPRSPIWGEHRSRYHFAAPLVAGKKVLDIACGTGFGGQILIAGGATEIVAVDYSEQALKSTKKLNPSKTQLLRGDGTCLPFADGTFEAITSFETVEHIPDYNGFVTELRRVLTDEGVLVISTPNANYTRPTNGKPTNPYHFYEFSPEEFEDLLLNHFSAVELFGQRVAPEYRICPYWELPDMLPQNPQGKLKTALWKLQSRMPYAVREWISQTLQGRQFFPGEMDFVFSASELNTGYVQVAVCRP